MTTYTAAAPETKDYEAEITNGLMSCLGACLPIVSRGSAVCIYRCRVVLLVLAKRLPTGLHLRREPVDRTNLNSMKIIRRSGRSKMFLSGGLSPLFPTILTKTYPITISSLSYSHDHGDASHHSYNEPPHRNSALACIKKQSVLLTTDHS